VSFSLFVLVNDPTGILSVPAKLTAMKKIIVLCVLSFVLPVFGLEIVPPAEEINKTKTALQELLKEYGKKNPAAQATLILDSARSAQNSAERYVYAREALAIALKIGDSALVRDATTFLCQNFVLDELAEHSAAALEVSSKTKDVVDSSIAAQYLLLICRQATQKGDEALAQKLAQAAINISRKHKDTALALYAKETPAWISETIKLAQQIPPPNILGEYDSNFDTVRGKLGALYYGEWEKSLPLLRAGNDADLAALARMELAATKETGVAVGDGWWALAEKNKGRGQMIRKQHAGFWYQAALPHLTGMTQMRITKRLEEIPFDFSAHPCSVDLWPLMTLAPGTFQGEWKSVNDSLVVDKNDAGDHITIPYVPYGNYRFEATFERLSPKGEVMFLIPIMTDQGPHSLNFFIYESGCAVHRINGLMVPSTNPEGRLAVGKRKDFAVEVEQGPTISIRIYLDQQQGWNWSGPANTPFGFHRKAKPTRPGALGLGAWNAKAAFYRARCTMLSGRVGDLSELPTVKRDAK
jgi:hypothetical protein